MALRPLCRRAVLPFNSSFTLKKTPCGRLHLFKVRNDPEDLNPSRL